jgi:hypothetical protein
MAYHIPDIHKPALVDRPWEAGVYVGVPNAVKSAAASRTVVSYNPLVSIPGSTKIVSNSKAQTTGSATSGSNQITVADASTFAVGHCIEIGSIVQFRIMGGCVNTGTLKLNISNHSYNVPLTAGQTAQQVATEIAAIPTFRGVFSAPVSDGGGWLVVARTQIDDFGFANFPGHAIFEQGTGVTFDPIGYSYEGVNYGVVSTFTGKRAEVTAKVGNVLTLSQTIPGTVTDVLVNHDDGPAVQAAINALSANEKLVMPSGLDLRIGTQFSISDKDDITVDMNYAHCDLWGSASSSSVSHSGDGYYNQTPAAQVTAGATKGSTSVTVTSSAHWSVGSVFKFNFGNDTALPVIAGGYDNTTSAEGGYYYGGQRDMYAIITGIPNGTTIEFDPPLYEDFSGVITYAWGDSPVIKRTGFENCTYDAINSAAGSHGGLYYAYACWLKNVKVSNGRNAMMGTTHSLKCEMDGVFADRIAGGGTNKLGIAVGGTTNFLLVNSIMYGMAPLSEVNGATWSAFAYNAMLYSEDDNVSAPGADFNIHAAHPSYNLVEGLWINGGFILDGYHGSSSHWTLFRNHMDSSNGWPPTVGYSGIKGPVIFKRFSRHCAVVGNQLLSSRSDQWGGPGYNVIGEPNIGNNSWTGEVEDSDWPEYIRALNPTAGCNLVTTQASPWQGRITSPVDLFLDSDNYQPAFSNPAADIWVNKRFQYNIVGVEDARNAIVDKADSGATPDSFTGQSVAVWPKQHNYQQLDKQVEATTLIAGNNSVFTNGVSSAQLTAIGNDAPLASMIWATRPAWLDEEETALDTTFEFPAFGPVTGDLQHRNEAIAAIPAGFRVSLAFTPRLQAALINTLGTTLTLQFNKPMQFGAGGYGGFTITNVASPVTLGTPTGEGTTSLVFPLSRTVLDFENEQPRLTYINPGNGLEDLNENDLDDISLLSVNNGSLQVGNVTEFLTLTGPEDTDSDTSSHVYGAFVQKLTVPSACTATKIRVYVSNENGQPPYNGPRVALFSMSGSTGTLISTGNLNYTGTNRWCSATLTPPVEIAAGTYAIAVRPSGSGPQFRTKAVGTSDLLFASTEGGFYSEFPTMNLGAADYNYTWLVGLRVTLPPDPNTPSSLTANAVSSSQIDLTWVDESEDETGFKIEMAIGAGGYSLIHTTAAGVESYSVTGLAASTLHTFRVSAAGPGGDSDYSNTASDTTDAPPVVPPAMNIGTLNVTTIRLG